MHNHPSGHANPSPPDLLLTGEIARAVSGFKGHVVIDSGEYGLIQLAITADGEVVGQGTSELHRFRERGAPDPLLSPSLPHPIIDRRVDNADEVAGLAVAIRRPGWFPVFYASQGQVRAIEEVPWAMLLDAEAAAAHFRERAVAYGSADLFLVANRVPAFRLAEDPPEVSAAREPLEAALLTLYKRNVFRDVTLDGWSFLAWHGRKLDAERAKYDLGLPVGEVLTGRTQRVREPATPYAPTPGEGPLGDLHAMRQAHRPTPGAQGRLAAAKTGWLGATTNLFEPLRRVTDALIAAGHPPALGTAPIEVAELTKNRILGTTQLYLTQYGRIYQKLHRAGLGESLDDYLTLRQFEKRIRDLSSRPENEVTPDGHRADGSFVNPREFDAAKVQDGLDQLERTLGPARWAQVLDAAESWWALNRQLLDAAHRVGVVGDAAYETITARGRDYVPIQALDYIIEAGDIKAPQRPYSLRYQDVLRRMEGTERDVRSVLASTVDKAIRTLATIERNRAARALLDWRRQIPQLVREVPTDTFRLPSDEVVVSAFINGRRRNFAVPRDIGRALHFLDAEQIGFVGKLLQAGALPLRAGATGANLAFAIPNSLRDMTRFVVYNKFGVRSPLDLVTVPIDIVRAVFHVVRGEVAGAADPVYAEFLRSGAAFSTMQKNFTPAQVLRRAARVRSWTDYVNLPRLLLETAMELNNVIEETPKVATLLRGRRAGASPAERAYEAANYGGSPNFGRAGVVGRQLNLIWMFFNARLQGTAANWRRLTESRAGRPGAAGGGRGAPPPEPPEGEQPMAPEPRGPEDPAFAGDYARSMAWLRLLLFIVLPEILLWLWNQQWDEDHGLEEVSETDKQRYNVVLTGDTYQHSTGQTRRRYWKLAKEETAQVVGPLVVAALDWLRGKDPKSARELALDLLGNVSPITMQFGQPTAFWPILRDASSGVLAGLNPVLRIPAEQLANYDARTKGAIVPRGLAENVLPPEQIRPTTSPTIREIARLLDVSPIRLEHMVGSATGGLGQGVLDTADRLRGRATPGVMTDWEAASLMPVLSRFVGAGGGARDRDTEERFYRVLEDATRAYGSLKTAAEAGETVRAREILNDPGLVVKASLHAELAEAARELAELRQIQAFLVYRAEQFSPAARQAALAEVAQQRSAFFGAFRRLETATEQFTQPLEGRRRAAAAR